MLRKEFFDSIHSTIQQNKLVEELQRSEIPVVVWGCGSLSYSVEKYLRKNSIEISCYWDDGVAEDSTVYRDNVEVLNMSQISKRYEKVNVVFGHSHYELKKNLKERYPVIERVFLFVNLCYEQWDGILKEFYEGHKEQYYCTYRLLKDNISRECMIAYLNCKLSENIDYVIDIYEEGTPYFANSFVSINDSTVYVDVGAYTGDTLAEFLVAGKGKYDKIFAFEPDKESFSLLEDYIKCESLDDIYVYNLGTWNERGVLSFGVDKESSSVKKGEIGEKTTQIAVERLDDILSNEKVDLVKINFLDGVVETLQGMEHILKSQRPQLVITVGFDEWGLINIPQIIKKCNPNYDIYLRYGAAMPARLTLFAV